MSVQPEGNPKTCQYVIIGEAPGKVELLKGRPFVGPSGNALNIILYFAGIKRDECYITNAYKDPAADITLLKARQELFNELADVPVKVPVILLGAKARDVVLGYESPAGTFAGRKWYSVNGRSFLASIHPAYLLRDHLEQAWYSVFDFRKLQRGRPTPPVQSVTLFHSFEEANAWLDKLDSPVISFDLETDRNDFQRDTVLCLGVSGAQGEVALLPDNLIYSKDVIWKGYENPVLPEHIQPEAVAWLIRLFSKDAKFVAHNGLYDLRFLVGQLGVHNARVDYDTLLAHYILWEDAPHDLKGLAREYFDIPSYEKEVHQHIKDGRWRYIPRDMLYEYCAIDVDITRRLWFVLEEDLMSQGLLHRPFKFPVMKVYPMVSDAEIKGFPIDARAIPQVGIDLDAVCNSSLTILDALVGYNAKALFEKRRTELFNLEKKGRQKGGVSKLQGRDKDRYIVLRGLRTLATRTINPNNTYAMQAAIFEVLGAPVPVGGRSSDAAARTDITIAAGKAVVRIAKRVGLFENLLTLAEASSKDALDTWLQKPEHVLDAITLLGKACKLLPRWVTTDLLQFLHYLEVWRGADKLRGSYIDNIVLGTDGAVHPSYKLHGTVTGRLSATDPAIQTIPMDTGLGRKVSSLFTVPSGYKIVYADFSQHELRTAAHMSGDKFMIEAFRQGRDFHGAVTARVYGEDYTPQQRTICKHVVFAWLFGGNVYSIAKNWFNFPEAASREFDKSWENTFARMAAYREELGQLMLDRGWSETLFGRRRRVYLYNSKTEADTEHMGQNMPIQGTATDINLLAANSFWRRWKAQGVWILALVHDSILAAVPDHLVEEASEDLASTMEQTARRFLWKIPHKADAKVGERWSEL